MVYVTPVTSPVITSEAISPPEASNVAVVKALGLAGGGTLAFNRISGSTEAYARQVLLATGGEDEGSGDVTIRAHDSTLIDASLRSVAAAVSVGKGGSKAVALGISVARNIIGQTPVSVGYDYKASDYQPDDKKLTELVPGKRVLNDTALMGTEVYEYIGV